MSDMRRWSPLPLPPSASVNLTEVGTLERRPPQEPVGTAHTKTSARARKPGLQLSGILARLSTAVKRQVGQPGQPLMALRGAAPGPKPPAASAAPRIDEFRARRRWARVGRGPDSVPTGSGPVGRLLPPGRPVGPTGSDKLTKTTFIQRLDTSGGVAPAASTCATAADAGKKALVPYSADYFFYKASQ
jgi:Protein of unknown function (DUF3455)